MPKEAKNKVRLIKRYANRKLYDVQSSRYIKLEGIQELVRAGEDVQVVDNDSGDDLTRVTLAQIIYEDEKKKSGATTLPLLRWMVERGDEAVRDFVKGVERGREALESVREATEKRVQQIISAPQRRLDELQKRLDAQVERVTHHPAVRGEIRRIEENIKLLEQRLGTLTGKRPAKRAVKRPKSRRQA